MWVLHVLLSCSQQQELCLTGELPKFLYQACFQQWISHVPLGTATQMNMASYQSWYSLVGATS